MRVGVIGMSDGNGHPYSFSAIINGYSDEGFKGAGWDVIHAYLQQRDPDEIGIDGVKVTHAWTQDRKATDQLCRATYIDHAVDEPEAMLGVVDAVLIARDDWESHYALGRVFLDVGIPVFIDKPLSLDKTQLDYFKPFLERGKLMSCSGLRFAKELEGVSELGDTLCVNGTVVLSWERYGVHILDAVFATLKARPVSIARQPVSHESFSLSMDDGSVFNINAIGQAPKTFRLEFFGSEKHVRVDMHDNFSAFRRTLQAFFAMCGSGEPAIDPRDTLMTMQTIMTGQSAAMGGPHVGIG